MSARRARTLKRPTVKDYPRCACGKVAFPSSLAAERTAASQGHRVYYDDLRRVAHHQPTTTTPRAWHTRDEAMSPVHHIDFKERPPERFSLTYHASPDERFASDAAEPIIGTVVPINAAQVDPIEPFMDLYRITDARVAEGGTELHMDFERVDEMPRANVQQGVWIGPEPQGVRLYSFGPSSDALPQNTIAVRPQETP